MGRPPTAGKAGHVRLVHRLSQKWRASRIRSRGIQNRHAGQVTQTGSKGDPPWWLRDIVVAGLLAGALFASQAWVDDARAERERAAAAVAATLADRRENLRFVRDHASPLLVPRSFVSIDLTDQKLPGLQLEGADFGEASLTGVDMSYAFLKNAKFQNADLSSSTLVFTDLEDAFMSHVSMPNADAGNSKMMNADLTEANLSKTLLKEADLSGANLPNANLSNANLTGSKLIDANLPGANLTGAILRRADVTNANLSRSNFIGADLSGANIAGADFDGADLRSASFRGSTGAGSAKFDKVCFDSTTLWPAGFDSTKVGLGTCPY
ncbi:Uncharacterized protein YjbI, contains pentapeptide repeats [Arthrobacter sp. ov118]|nr:Uncharacterized protein YjbI, contains pentapeptide repeats [Arthrobacter sp. ov118]